VDGPLGLAANAVQGLAERALAARERERRIDRLVTEQFVAADFLDDCVGDDRARKLHLLDRQSQVPSLQSPVFDCGLRTRD
jgi:hypothetical protein